MPFPAALGTPPPPPASSPAQGSFHTLPTKAQGWGLPRTQGVGTLLREGSRKRGFPGTEVPLNSPGAAASVQQEAEVRDKAPCCT